MRDNLERIGKETIVHFYAPPPPLTPLIILSYKQFVLLTYLILIGQIDRLCGLVVRIPGYRFRGPGSIPGTTRFSEKSWV
jgi:hypothetical protein